MPTFHIRSLRGEIEETRHAVHLVVADAAGTVRASAGNAGLVTPMRSAAKPFQALPLVTSGAVERFGVTPPELALICASHNSELRQVEGVAALLGRIGGTAADLVCRAHRPLYKELGFPLAPGPDEVPLAPPSRLASNCSGKHTGMLVLAAGLGVNGAGYEDPDHAVQSAGRAAVAEWCGVEVGAVTWGRDGCGVPSWAIPLDALARGFAKLGAGDDEAATTVRSAMLAHPEMVAGERRLCTALMRAYPDEVVAKVGAGGVYGASLPRAGLGVAIKIEDGNSIAAGAALLAVLEHLGLLPDLPGRLGPYVTPAVLNTLRDVVGRYEPVGRVEWN